MLYRIIFVSFVLIRSFGLASPAWADPVAVDIPPQSLSRALLLFSSQAKIQVVTAPGVILSGITAAVHGNLEPAAVLDRLLTGTGLEYEFTAPTSVVIRSKPSREPSKEVPSHSAVPAPAATAATADTLEIEEITVTAQRREESVERTPVSAAVLTSKDMSERHFVDLKDLDNVVPSLSINSPQGTILPKFTLRAVGSSSYNQNVDSTVPVYLDEFVLAPSSAQLDQSFDLERVEVLSGPQGTLYGKNSTGGAINLVTRKPTGSDSASISITAARYGEYDTEVAGEVALTDNWSLRVAGKRATGDGYGFNQLDDKPILGSDYTGGRATLRYIDGATDVLVKVFGSKTVPDPIVKTDGVNTDGTPRPDNSNPLSGYITPGNPFIAAFTPTHDSTRNSGATVNAQWQAGPALLHSVSGYLDSFTHVDFDCDGSPADLCAAGPFDTYSRSLSQELRAELGNKTTGRVIAGVSYFQNQYVINDLYKLGLDLGLPAFYDYIREKDRSTAVFVDGTYPITSALELTAGVRYTYDSKDFQHTAPGFSFLGGPYDYKASQDWKQPTYRAILDYTLTDNQMAYASYSKGYRAGAFDAGLITTTDQFHPVNPEILQNYEVGFKANYFNRRLVGNLALYRENYTDQQVVALLSTPGAVCCSLVNAASSRIDGIELDVRSVITQNFSVRLTGSGLHARYQTFSVGTTNYAGRILGNAPKFQIFLTPEYHVAAPGGELFVASDVRRIGETRVGTTIDPYDRETQRPYTLIDARAGYRGQNSPFEIVAFVKNLQNRRYLTDWASFATFGFDEIFYGAPRTYGLTINYRVGAR